MSFVEHRLPLFVCALLVPEYVLAWAIRQYLKAREIAHKKGGEFGYLVLRISFSNLSLDLQWSKTHGFFIIMGGFHLFKRGSKRTSDKPISHKEDTPLHPLAAINLYGDDTTLDIDFSSFTVPTEEEIKDKGKSDWLAKSLVLFQTSWFVIQCIARGVERLPITHLEIVTLAYAAMNFVIYVFWWNKPLNVNRPVRVFRKSDVEEPTLEGRRFASGANRDSLETIFNFIAGGQDDGVNLGREDRVPRFWANSTAKDALTADLIVLGVGVCFGAIHCIAWGFTFPTHAAESLIWRISSVAITAVPFYIPLTLLLATWLGNMDFDNAAVIIGGFATFSILPAGVLYILARVFTLALAFTSLRDLPHGAFDTVHWTTFIPHV